MQIADLQYDLKEAVDAKEKHHLQLKLDEILKVSKKKVKLSP
jgi:hypothetical protein